MCEFSEIGDNLICKLYYGDFYDFILYLQFVLVYFKLFF